jgi:hypothetical protein
VGWGREGREDRGRAEYKKRTPDRISDEMKGVTERQ